MSGSSVTYATQTGRASPTASFEGYFVGAAIAGTLYLQTGAVPIAAMAELSNLKMALMLPRHC
jgi:hypothetical protein